MLVQDIQLLEIHPNFSGFWVVIEAQNFMARANIPCSVIFIL